MSGGMTPPMYLEQYSKSGSRRGSNTRQGWLPCGLSREKLSVSFRIKFHPWCLGFVRLICWRISISFPAEARRCKVLVALTLIATYFSVDHLHLIDVSSYTTSSLAFGIIMRVIPVEISSKPNGRVSAIPKLGRHLISTIQQLSQPNRIKSLWTVIWCLFFFDRTCKIKASRRYGARRPWLVV